MRSFQQGVGAWARECFGITIAADRTERNHRFLEEALELVQAYGCTREDAYKLVDYTFNRPVGDRFQEVGGVMITLAALCCAQELDMERAGAEELLRVNLNKDKIRAKQKMKPKFGPLAEIPISKPSCGNPLCRAEETPMETLTHHDPRCSTGEVEAMISFQPSVKNA